MGYNFELGKTDELGTECDDLPVQHLRNGHSRDLPLAAWIIGTVDCNHCVGFVYGLQVRFELTAHGFLIGHVYDFRTGKRRLLLLYSR